MISVCMAVHNGGSYVLEQLNSILKQLSENDEIVISDDGSIDDTLEVINSLNDHRIKIVYLQHKRDYSKKKLPSYYYASENFANALQYASGDIIFLSDQDDIWEDYKVERCLSSLKSVDIICHNFSVMDKDGLIVEPLYMKYVPSVKLKIFEAIWRLPFRGCCLAFNRSVYEITNPLPSGVFLHDCYIGIKAICKGLKYEYINEPLIRYRRHGNNVSELSAGNSLFFKLHYRLKLLWLAVK